GYTAEQQAYGKGLMDKFIPFADVESCSPPDQGAPHLVMDYYDGNTVTGLWNYAQHFAMSDSSYSTVFGPSTPGAINVTGANTFGAICGGNLNATPCTAAPGTTPATRVNRSDRARGRSRASRIRTSISAPPPKTTLPQ